jgi:hypothetical protein
VEVRVLSAAPKQIYGSVCSFSTLNGKAIAGVLGSPLRAVEDAANDDLFRPDPIQDDVSAAQIFLGWAGPNVRTV